MKHKTARMSQITITQLMLPTHSNFSGKIHGGFILNLMDQVAFACASKHSGHYCVTASVNRVDFLNPVEVGEILNLKASVNFTGNSSMVIGLRVEAENVQTGSVKHCNSSYFTMVAIDENGKKAKVPGLLLENNDDIRRFARSVKRQEQSRARGKDFTPSEFKADDYIKLLEKHNVKIDLDHDSES